MGSIITQSFNLADTSPTALNVSSVGDQLEAAKTAVYDLVSSVGELMANLSGSGTTFPEYNPGDSLLALVEADPMAFAADSSGLALDDPVFLGEFPSLPGLDISIESMPEFAFSRPGIDIPAPPDIDWPTFTEDPPAINMPDLPTAPSVVLPNPPTIEDVIVPAPPPLLVPEFDGVAPNIDLTPPTTSFDWRESAYTSALLSVIKSTLETDVATGGSGHGDTVEQQIYDRELARTYAKEEEAYFAVLEDAESRGWSLPPGEAMGQIIDLSDRINKQREEQDGKLIAQQTELAQRNTHLAWSMAVKIESRLLKHHGRVQQRSFEAAKFTLESAVALYRTKVEAYRARAQSFSVLADVYEARIRAEIVKAEYYKAHIEGLKVGVEANRLKIEVYQAQLKGIAALVEMYKAEMQAGKVIAEVERTRMQSYLAQVEAYRVRVEAIQAQYEGYVAQVRGEIVKADMVKADAQAAKAHARAYKAQADVELERARAAVDVLKAQLQVYLAQVEKYAQDVRKGVGTQLASGRLSKANADLRVIQARYNAAAEDLKARNLHAQGTMKQAEARSQGTAEESEISARTIYAQIAEETERAANDAATMVQVATNASDTTSSSKNHRGAALINGHIGKNKNHSWTDTGSVSVGFYNYYTRNA